MKKEILVPVGNTRECKSLDAMAPLCQREITKIYRGKAIKLSKLKLVQDACSGLYPSVWCGILSGPLFSNYMIPFLKNQMTDFTLLKVNTYSQRATGIKKSGTLFLALPKSKAIFKTEEEFRKSSKTCGCINGTFVCKPEFVNAVFYVGDVILKEFNESKKYPLRKLRDATELFAQSRNLKDPRTAAELFATKCFEAIKNMFDQRPSPGIVGISIIDECWTTWLWIRNGPPLKRYVDVSDFDQQVKITNWKSLLPNYDSPNYDSGKRLFNKAMALLKLKLQRTKPRLPLRLVVVYGSGSDFDDLKVPN